MNEYIVCNGRWGMVKRKKHSAVRRMNPCSVCAKAPCDGCNWAKYKLPVAGWIAEPITIPQNYPFDKGYRILYCPEFEEKGKSNYHTKYKKEIECL